MNRRWKTCSALLLASLAIALAHPAAADSIELDNAFTGGKLLTLPPTSAESSIVDLAVIDSAFGGSDAKFPDVFAIMQKSPGEIVIDIFKSDRSALDFGRLDTSPAIALPGDVAAVASHPSQAGYPTLAIACNDGEEGSICLVDTQRFEIARTINVDGGIVRDIAMIDRPREADGSAAAATLQPAIVAAVETPQGSELRVYSAADGAELLKVKAPAGDVTAIGAGLMPGKSKLVGIDASYPWLLVATQLNGKASLTLVNTKDGAHNGGPVAAPPGRVTGIAIAPTAFAGEDADAPEIFVSYATPDGANQISIYNAISNVQVATYPPRTPQGRLVGLSVHVTGLNLGIGGEGHGTIFYAITSNQPPLEKSRE